MEQLTDRLYPRLKPYYLLVNGRRRDCIYNLVKGSMHALSEDTTMALRNAIADGIVSDAGLELKGLPGALQQMLDIYEKPVVVTPLRFGPSERLFKYTRAVRINEIGLVTNYECNLDCVFCSRDSLVALHGTGCSRAGMLVDIDAVMQEGEYRGVLQEAKKLGASSLTISGGEPLMDPTLVGNIVTAAKILGYKSFNIMSNITLWQELTAFLKQAADKRLFFTILVMSRRPDIHDKLTRCPGSFDNMINGVDILRGKGSRYIFKLLVSRCTLNEYMDDVAFFKGMGAQGVVIDFIHTQDVTLGGSKAVLSRASDPRRRLQRVSAQSIFLFRDGHPCLKGKVAISPSGRVLPCPMMRDFVVGSIREKPLARIVGNPTMQEIWGLTVSRLDKCNACEFRLGCFDCRALQRSGNGLRGKRFCSYDPGGDVGLA